MDFVVGFILWIYICWRVYYVENSGAMVMMIWVGDDGIDGSDDFAVGGSTFIL